MISVICNTDLASVPVNAAPLVDDIDFKTREESVAYNASGMDLVWNFTTLAGVTTQTAVTPTSGGVHDWTHLGNAVYTLEIPKSGGTINNNTPGTGFFSGVATGVLPWRGPDIECVMGGEITSGTPTTTAFIASALTGAHADHYKDAWVTFLTGACAGVTKKITAFDASTDTVTVDALPTAPSVGDKFILINGA